MTFDFIPAVMREASKIMLRAHHIDAAMHQKTGDQNFVTEFDVATENFLMEQIRCRMADAVFIGEEKENDPALLRSGKPCFIIDPIDGTTNFIHDLRCSAISVGVCLDGSMVYGAIYDPYSDTMYHAERGKGACYSIADGVERKMAVCGKGLSDSLVMFGTTPYKRDQFADKTFAMLRKIFSEAREIRCLGSAALHLCYVACGRAGAFVECELSPWDFAAGSVIIEEAGGVLSQSDGSPLVFDRPCSVVAAAPQVYTDLMTLSPW